MKYAMMQLEVFMDVISDYGSQKVTPEDVMFVAIAKTGEYTTLSSLNITTLPA